MFSVFDIYLIGIATILFFVVASRYFALSKKKDNPIEKSIVKSYAYVIFFIGIYLIFITLSFFYIEGEYKGHIYWGNVNNPSLIYMWLIKGAYISFLGAFIYYFNTYEKIFKKKHHFGLIATIVIVIMILLLPYEFVLHYFFPFSYVVMMIYYGHTMFNLMKRSQKDLRAATSFIILGSVCTGQFVAFISPAFLRFENAVILIFPIVLIVGILLNMAPTVFKPEYFSRNIKYWYLFTFILAGNVLISVFYVFLVIKILEYLIMAIIFFVFYLVEGLFTIRFIKREESQEFTTSDVEVMGIFTKPKKISEEEIMFHKEKKICLVCKGKIGGFMFTCIDCDALYCDNCARTLSNLENACWVCNTPFDKTKPSRPYREKEEEITIEATEKSLKKHKSNKKNNY
jgi:hypothetical protein